MNSSPKSVIEPDTYRVIEPPSLQHILQYFGFVLLLCFIILIPVAAIFFSRKSSLLLAIITIIIFGFLFMYGEIIIFVIFVILDRHSWRGQGCLLNERSGIIYCKGKHSMPLGF